MLQVSVVSNIQQALTKIGSYEDKQLRFAVAKSLTNVAQEIQKQVRDEMPSRFTLRRSWIQKGIRVIPATKANLQATVGSIDPFMERQELGQYKVPMQAGGKHIAIPTSNVRRTRKDIIAKAELPSQLGARGFKIKSSDGRLFLAKRFAKGKRAGLQFLYKLQGKAFVKKRLGLLEIGNKVIAARFESIFTKNLMDAQNAPPRQP